MGFQFDHLIHYVNDAHDAQKILNKKGFSAVAGGRHESRGSYNTLLHFGLSYIEFLAIDDFDLFKKVKADEVKWSPFWTLAKDEFREGFLRVNFRTKNLDQLAEDFREKGLEVNGPVDLSRKQPDGTLLEWKLVYANDPNSDVPLPFFIDWKQTDEERKAFLEEKDIIVEHENGEASIQQVTYVVKDLEKTINNWSQWFDLEKEAETFSKEWNAKTQTLLLPGGNIQFIEPVGEGVAQEKLDTIGERLVSLEIDVEQSLDSFKYKGAQYIFC